MQTRRGVIAGIVGVIGVVAWQAVATSQQQEPPDDQLPRFAPGGQLLPPVGWEAWVMVGSSTGLSYAAARPPAAGAAPGMFHNVCVQPWAYREFVRTGAFPARTMFVLSLYEASRKSPPARSAGWCGVWRGSSASDPSSSRACLPIVGRAEGSPFARQRHSDARIARRRARGADRRAWRSSPAAAAGRTLRHGAVHDRLR